MALQITKNKGKIIFTNTVTGVDYPYRDNYVEGRFDEDGKVYFVHQLPTANYLYPFGQAQSGVRYSFAVTDVQDDNGVAFSTKGELIEYLSEISSKTIDDEPEINYAITRIKQDFGDNVSVFRKGKSLFKFGRNTKVGNSTSGYTLWSTGTDEAHETYVSTNAIDTLSSSSASDSETVVIEGHTISGTDLTFVVQTATLNGQNKVTLTTPLARATRIYNDNGTNLVGNIYVYEDTAISSGKPTDTTKIHLSIRAGKNQSEKASRSISSTDYWILTSFRGSVLEKSASFADVEIQVRQLGKVFRQIEDVACSSNANGVFEFYPYFIVPPNSDVRLVAVADGANTDVSGSIQGYLGVIY